MNTEDPFRYFTDSACKERLVREGKKLFTRQESGSIT